jgi:molybdate transport system substrate-binding protein
MISADFYGVYSELRPAFERASGHHLVTTRGPSMGDSPEAIPARLARAEAADVVILDGRAADELATRALVRADSKIELARSLIGMVVRSGAEKPGIANVEALRRTLLERLIPILGPGAVMGGVAQISASIVAPGVIQQVWHLHRTA